MEWKDIKKDGFPSCKNGKDVNVLLRVLDAPMEYVAAVWDGYNFWMLFPMEKSPWITVPSWVGITEWTYI